MAETPDGGTLTVAWPGEEHRIWGIETDVAGTMADGGRPLVSDNRDLKRWGNGQVRHYRAIEEAGLTGAPRDPQWDRFERAAWATGRDERRRLAREDREERVRRALARARQAGLDGRQPGPGWGERMMAEWRAGRFERGRARQRAAWAWACRLVKSRRRRPRRRSRRRVLRVVR